MAPITRSALGWTRPMQQAFLRASGCAGWNDQQRYLAMRHCGCPDAAKHGRPSTTHPKNTRDSFLACMELAEACAAADSVAVPPPKSEKSWRDAARASADNVRHFARRIAAEGVRRLPGVFDDGLLGYAVRHITGDDSAEVSPRMAYARPVSIDDCDLGQAMRVVESLRAHVGRELDRRGLAPEGFRLPQSVIARRTRRPEPDAGGDSTGAAPCPR